MRAFELIKQEVIKVEFSLSDIDKFVVFEFRFRCVIGDKGIIFTDLDELDFTEIRI